MDLLEFGEHVKAARKEQGLTQEALSVIAGVSRQTISAFEQGHMFDMNFSTVQKLIEAVGLTLKPIAQNNGRPTYEEIVAQNREDQDFETPSLG